MRLLQLFETINLFEAKQDRYFQQFENLIPYSDALGTGDSQRKYINEEVSWALNTLKKDDKIIWYLRYIKLFTLVRIEMWLNIKISKIEGTPEEETFKAMVLKIERAQQKLSNQMATKMNMSQQDVGAVMEKVRSPKFKETMEHFMSLGIEAIDDYVFSWQTPEQIIADWTPIEKIWQDRQGQIVPDDEEYMQTPSKFESDPPKVLIEYPDGSQWVDLHRPYCEIYGDAHGTCGNSATWTEDDTSIVYRVRDEDEPDKWNVKLFFILDTKTGLLGETKGRVNQKPSEKYHNVIVDLLKQKQIKGIRGGGYKPENNFKMEDLPEETAEALINEKPALASIAFDYKKRGMTKGLIKRMQLEWDDIGEELPPYNKKQRGFLQSVEGDIDGFTREYGGDTGTYIADVMNGSADLDMWNDSDQSEQVWDELPSKIQKQVGLWLIEEHENAVEEWKENNDQDFDGSDSSDTWNIIEENDIDEVKTALNRGVETGLRYGAEAAMHKSLTSWIEDLPNENDFALSLVPGTKSWDSQQSMHITEDDIVDITSNYLEDVEHYGDLISSFQIKELESPYNGWDGYDEKAAVEDAIEQLHEEGVLSR